MRTLPFYMTDSAKTARLAEPALRQALVRFVRTKVSDSDVDDVVQATLADAVASDNAPTDAQELRKWVFGIARHKIADHFRATSREAPRDSVSSTEAAAESAPLSARDLLRWAESELPDGDRAEGTLDWMLREGDGEKLEHIANERNVDAARVRQRVSRLRRYFRERWAAQLAAVAAIVLIAGAAWWLWPRRPGPDLPIVHVPPSAEPSPQRRAEELRRAAFDACDKAQWRQCLDGLDDAARLDPAGDTASPVQQARRRAEDALAPPAPSSSWNPSTPPLPTSSSVPSAPPVQTAPPPKPPQTSMPVPTAPSRKNVSSDWGSVQSNDKKSAPPMPPEGMK